MELRAQQAAVLAGDKAGGGRAAAGGVANAEARGVHFIQVLPERCDLEVCRMQLRARLRQLDKDYPELARAAHRAGMRSLGELEVYPTPSGAIRLPLCRGRTVLLDRPLGLVLSKYTQRLTQDVAGYMGWLADLQKRYMPAEEVLAYVLARLHVPARTVCAGQDELGVGELGVGGLDGVGVMCAKLRERGGAAASDVAEEVLGLVAELIEVWADREMTGHDEPPWSVARCPLTGVRRFGCSRESGG